MSETMEPECGCEETAPACVPCWRCPECGRVWNDNGEDGWPTWNEEMVMYDADRRRESEDG